MIMTSTDANAPTSMMLTSKTPSTPTKKDDVSLKEATTSNKKRSIVVSLVPEEFLCALTFTVMEDPLVTKSGLNFERSAILDWLNTRSVCPVTQEPLLPSMLIHNVPLQIRIRQWQNSAELAREKLGDEDKKTEDQLETLSLLGDSWCWDADLFLSDVEEVSSSNSSNDLSPLPINVAVCSIHDDSGDEKFERNEETIAAIKMPMESSKKDVSHDISPQIAMPQHRPEKKHVLQAARSA